MKRQEALRRALERDMRRLAQGKSRHPGVLGFLVYGGSLGLLMVLPIVLGAYLGQWLDSLSEAFSTRWTVSLILLGVVAGVFNVIYYLRRHL